jgi:hypothetical protein
MPPYNRWKDVSEEVLESVYKPKLIDYVYRCPRCGLEICRCGAMSLSKINSGMKHLVVSGTIVNAEQPSEIETKYGRTIVTRGFLEDPSRKMRINLWGEHAESARSGSVVRIENAFCSEFKGEPELNLGWRGILISKSSENLKRLEEELCYSFKNEELLVQALTRRSYINENVDENTKTSEPLSFLGDAVLDLAVSEYLFLHNPELAEGELSLRFQGLTSEPQCAIAGMKLKLYNYLHLGDGERPISRTPRIMAEAYEGLIGAIFLDGRYEVASEVVKKTLLPPSMNH